MAHAHRAHRRTHNLLLISKLLSQQTQTSPFTLIQDTLEQSAKPLLKEYLCRANAIKNVTTIFLAFETFSQPQSVDHFMPCHDVGGGTGWQRIARNIAAIQRRVLTSRFVIVIDSMTMLVALSQTPASHLDLTAFFASLLQPQPTGSSGDQQQLPAQVSVIATYHTDVPLPTPPSNSYRPHPLTLLSYLATTIITVHSLTIILAAKAAQAKSLTAPSFGLSSEIEGVLIGLKSRSSTSLKPVGQGIVLELEHRRKSGRGVKEWFFLPSAKSLAKSSRETVILLDDHPLFDSSHQKEVVDDELSGMTFELGLTERQKLEREGVVLPYFDAQKAGGGAGEGGRILYDMGVEDDFDEEEDEI